MVGCFVSNCRPSLEGSQTKHLFSPSNDPIVRAKWINALCPENLILSNTIKVCARHFKDTDIVRGDTVSFPNGEVLFKHFKRWRLLPHAYPSINLGKKWNGFNLLKCIHVLLFSKIQYIHQ